VGAYLVFSSVRTLAQIPGGVTLDSVTVHVLTFNHAKYIERCVQSVLDQRYGNVELIVSDNASQDGTPDVVAEHFPSVKLIRNKSNLGYSRGHNEIISKTRSTFFLALNPDVVLEKGFVERCVQFMGRYPRVGTIAGKLLSISDDDFVQYKSPLKGVIDSAGIYFQSNQRHFDRGAGQLDVGQFDEVGYVFGATGAAAFYRRSMLDDIKLGGEYFDEDFFAYREDVDLAWRAQLFGWDTLYIPSAYAYHVRKVFPWNRREHA